MGPKHCTEGVYSTPDATGTSTTAPSFTGQWGSFQAAERSSNDNSAIEAFKKAMAEQAQAQASGGLRVGRNYAPNYGSCPSCGHCRHCGRGGYGQYPTYPTFY